MPNTDRIRGRHAATPAPRPQYDVAIVGASLAGCTAAVLYAQRGARVALLEQRPDPGAWKRVCTHYIQSSALPTIERIGLADPLHAAGAARTDLDVWTRYGWTRPPAPRPGLPPHSLNVRREVLDPLLRDLAAGTDGVDLLLGRKVDRLLKERGRVAGVEAASPDGSRTRLTARLVVGADGRSSRVADLAGVRAKVRELGRAGFWMYFRDVPSPPGNRSRMWLLDPDTAYAFPTDRGVTLIAVMIGKERVRAFKRDAEASFMAMVSSLPEAPAIRGASHASPMLGKLDQPNLWRPAAAGGVALVGDAAVTSDPLWGVGCGFAFQSAEWLVDATADAVTDGERLDTALRRYRRRHARRLRGHFLVTSHYSTGRAFNPAERLLYAAAARDRRLAGRIRDLGTRNTGPVRFLAPALGRAAAVTVRDRLLRRGARQPGRLIPALARPEELSEADVDEMWSLTRDAMADCPRDAWDAIVRGAHRVVILRDAGQSRIRGYCPVDVATYRMRRGRARVITARLTVIDERYHGQAVLNRALTRLALRQRATHRGRHYVFALIAGSRMYSKFVKWLPAAWPSRMSDWPPRERELCDAIARFYYGERLSAQRGTVEPVGMRWREDLTVPPPAWRGDPDVAFFEQANPGHPDGAMLPCLARLDLRTFVAIGLRLLRRRRREAGAYEQSGHQTAVGRAPVELGPALLDSPSLDGNAPVGELRRVGDA